MSWNHRGRALLASVSLSLSLSVSLLLPLAALPASAEPGLAWRPCPTRYSPTAQCASVTVPIDRGNPDGGTRFAYRKGAVTLPLVRLPAEDPAHRIGSLLTNPGGPGGSGVDVISYGGQGLALQTPELAELRKRFDVIGFDPRGVGHTTPAITCDPKKLYDPAVNRFPASRAEYDALVAHNRAAGEDCLARTGPLLSQVDTQSAAEDIESIRVALGESRISWLGVSYGTELGAAYAAKYPGRLRAMVLDGAVDHSRPTRRSILEEAAATEDGLLRFVSWCAGSGECAMRGQDVLAKYDALLSAHGVPSSQLGRDATPDELAAGFYGYLYVKGFWPLLSQALAQATSATPDASGLTGAAQFFSPSYAAYRAVGCHDSPAPFTGPVDMRVMGELLKTAAPHSWRYSEFWDFTSGCTGWPIPANNPPHARPVRGSVGILVVGNTHDPSTPLVWARGLAADIRNSTLLINDGDGHTGLLNSPCVRAEEAKYLVSGIIPAPGTSCADSREQAAAPAR
ncbi:alpha/beta hydrolase [Amycolatopsis sp. H20-H5]|uniref:alpha/beta hydrolase n=1 Tax=Amycolatopsis sp. H20-H5 TaxID=3046309 RepID=UPI002DB5C260|nr:alpha/beta hydrolase [Amycolatopsis sp. H20-H5]MEC3975616.1 alpha/beta hydrolase [Amycolatopsis sp. H20-H5]